MRLNSYVRTEKFKHITTYIKYIEFTKHEKINSAVYTLL